MSLRLNKKRIITISLVVLQAAIVCAFVWLRLGIEVGTPKEGETTTFSTNTPDETKVDKQTYEWVGLDTEPKYIYLPTIGAEGFIQKVGVDQNKQIAVPNNIHFAGWFTDSSLPGQKGLSIIDGHVTGRFNDAIFKDLTNIKVDDTFQVEFGDNTKKTFKVFELQTIAVDEAASVLFSQKSKISSQLNLITCTGDFDEKNQLYNKRLIVYSTLIN